MVAYSIQQLLFMLKMHNFLQTGWTPLIIASSAGHVRIVQMLLDRGANVNAYTHNGHTALQYAASKNRVEVHLQTAPQQQLRSLLMSPWVGQIMELLLAHNAEPNVKDERGATPLHRAASRGNLRCVQLLIEIPRVASTLDTRDADGNTALYGCIVSESG